MKRGWRANPLYCAGMGGMCCCVESTLIVMLHCGLMGGWGVSLGLAVWFSLLSDELYCQFNLSMTQLTQFWKPWYQRAERGLICQLT